MRGWKVIALKAGPLSAGLVEMPQTHRVSASTRRVVLAGLALSLLCLGGLSGISQTLAQQFATSSGEESTRLHGVVLNRATHEPVARALVVSNDNHYAALTDDRGRFEFVFPPPKPDPQPTPNATVITHSGRIRTWIGSERAQSLDVRKPGFLSPNPAQDWVPIGPKQSEVTLYLVPEARVIGRVMVNGSDASDRIRVSLYRRQRQGGREQWTGAAETAARMDGEFRFADLAPGAYKVFTREFIDRDPLTFDPQGQLFGYPPMYYPAAADFESGEVIQLAAGQTFQATITPVRREYYRVRMDLGGAQLGGPNITIWPQGHPGPGYELGYDPRTQAVRGLLPNGTYTVSVQSYQQPVLAGETTLTVAGAAVNGARVTLAPPTSIAVNVQEEFQKERPQSTWTTSNGSGEQFTNNPRRPSYLNLALISDNEFGRQGEYQMRPPSGPDDTSLVFENLPSGRYRVRAFSQIGYVASVTSDGKDLLHQPLVVAAGAAPPEIVATVRDDGAEVDGVVEVERKAGTGPPDAAEADSAQTARPIYFLPEGSGAQFVQTWMQPDGHFQLQQVAPGEYRVLAVDRPVTDLEGGGDNLGHEYEAHVQRVTLEAGQKAHLRLKLFSVTD
jgi:hypothetical protein